MVNMYLFNHWPKINLNLGITHCINETQAKIIYTTYDLLPKVGNLLKKCTSLTTVIFVDSPRQSESNNNAYKFPSTIQLLPISKLYNDGKLNNLDISSLPLGAEDLQLVSFKTKKLFELYQFSH